MMTTDTADILSLDRVCMQRALDLGAIARGYTEPNPMVGAVIVSQGRIIGEGYHHRAGEPHAEVMAIASVKDVDIALLRGATMYVSLEPCSHHGKTPPCAELLIRKQIGRVVIAMSDPYPQVSGRGIAMLKHAGIDVSVGLMECEAVALNEVFLTVQRLGRPFITLKWAQSADGFVDRIRSSSQEKPTRLSSPLRQRYVHRLRSRHGAILVGGRTAMLDNPALDVRYWCGRDPLRIVWSDHEELDPDLQIFDGRPSLVVCRETALTSLEERVGGGVTFLRVKEGGDPLDMLLAELLRRGIHSLLVEGGSMVLQSFLDRGLYDKIDCERTSALLGEGVCAPSIGADLGCF